jgi:hypothetical protein
MPDQIPDGSAHPRLVVVGAEHQLADLGEHDRPGALRARLERHVEGAAVQSVGAERLERALDREQLGVGRGIAAVHGFIVRPRDDPIALHDDGADGHFVQARRMPRLFERRRHAWFRHGSVRT